MREKMIRLLGQCPCDGGKELGNCPYRKHGVCAEIYKIDYCAIQNLADHLIANGVTVQEWISVKDRLPKDTYEYWVAYKVGNDYFYTTGYFDGKYWRAAPTLRHILVTHWMPLPEDPKGE